MKKKNKKTISNEFEMVFLFLVFCVTELLFFSFTINNFVHNI